MKIIKSATLDSIEATIIDVEAKFYNSGDG